MKKIRQICMFALMLGLMTVLFVALGTSASAETYGDLKYTVSNGEIAITDCNTSATEVVIPETIDGYPVTSIGYEAFSGCTSLTSITIPDSVTRIGNYAFSGCTSLTSITIPDSVTRIGNFAFYDCTTLTSITIGDSVTTIGNYAFSGCTSLANITVDENNSNYLSDEYGVLFNKDKTLLIQYPAGNTRINYNIPDSVTRIDYGAFSGCTFLTSITIPDSVTSIGARAFVSCTGLTKIYWNAINPEIDWDEDAGASIFGNAGNKETGIDVVFGNSVERIPDLFVGETSATSNVISVTISDGVKSIGAGAFRNCPLLKNVTIPDSVTSIDDSAFRNCTLLKNVTIPDSVTSIGNYAFYGCSSFTDITIPGSVTSIGNYAFNSCGSLEKITINNSDCVIYNSIYTIPSGTTIYGHCSSTAQAYAEKYDRNFISLENVAVVTAPTCTEKGFTTYTCSACGDSYVDDYVDATGHSFNRVVVVKAYTCTRDGLVRLECVNCDNSREIEVIAPGHDYVETEVNGETKLVCAVCGDGNPDNIVIPDDTENEPAVDSENDTTVDSKDDNCSCNCHSNNALLKFFYKLAQFFWKLFGMKENQICDCGVAHW